MDSEISLEQQQKLNRLLARANWPRTSDLLPDELVPGKIVPKATSTKADWFGPFRVDAPSTFQLMNAGVDVTHLIALSYKSPDDLMYSEGRVRRNALGRGFCLAVGDYWVYVPLLTGDPAFFTARLSDASSDLPAQQAALEGDGSPSGAQVVTTLNRAAVQTNQKNVTTHGTGVQLPSMSIPGGFKAVVKAKTSNTGNIYMGSSKANAENHALAYILAPGEALPGGITDTSLWWIDSDVDGEGVCIAAEA